MSKAVPTLHLVACAATKLDHSAPAKDLYVSPWFVKARAYAEAQGGEWRILSAKHGVVHPNNILLHYEETLIGASRERREAWASHVLRQLDFGGFTVPGARIVFLAGTAYREPLVPWLQLRNVEVEVPMRGLGIGQQLVWLTARATAAQP